MKKLLIAVVLGIMTAPAMAETNEYCEFAYDDARMIMKARQAGLPIKELMAVTKKMVNEGVKNKELTKDEARIISNVDNMLTMKAYEIPLYLTDEYKQREINEFSNSAYVSCLNFFKNKQGNAK